MALGLLVSLLTENLFFCCGILLLVVFRDEVFHVALSLGEIHLVPALTCVEWRKAFQQNMAESFTQVSLNNSGMAVLFPMKVTTILRPQIEMLQTAVLTLLGIDSRK